MQVESSVLCGEFWETEQDQKKFACFVNHLDILLWGVGWKAFKGSGMGEEICFRKQTLVVMKDGLEGRINGNKIICWLFHLWSRYQEGLNKQGGAQEHKEGVRTRLGGLVTPGGMIQRYGRLPVFWLGNWADGAAIDLGRKYLEEEWVWWGKIMSSVLDMGILMCSSNILVPKRHLEICVWSSGERSELEM